MAGQGNAPAKYTRPCGRKVLRRTRPSLGVAQGYLSVLARATSRNAQEKKAGDGAVREGGRGSFQKIRESFWGIQVYNYTRLSE